SSNAAAAGGHIHRAVSIQVAHWGDTRAHISPYRGAFRAGAGDLLAGPPGDDDDLSGVGLAAPITTGDAVDHVGYVVPVDEPRIPNRASERVIVLTLELPDDREVSA